MLVLGGYGQALKGLAGLQGFYGTDWTAGPQGFMIQTDHITTALCTDDKIRAEGQQVFSALLRHAAADNQAGRRLFPADFPDQLQGFLVSGSGYGTGVDKVDIRRLIHGNNLIAIRLEELQHGLGIILIDFTAKGMGSDGFHDYSISPYKHMMADTAASPAVSVRRIRLPRVTGVNAEA